MSGIECHAWEVSDLQDEKVALHQQTELLGKENASLKKEVRALSGYKDRCEHLQDMSDELASTAKGNQMLLLNAEKLQLELNSEKDKTFQLEAEKSSVEHTVLNCRPPQRYWESGSSSWRRSWSR